MNDRPSGSADRTIRRLKHMPWGPITSRSGIWRSQNQRRAIGSAANLPDVVAPRITLRPRSMRAPVAGAGRDGGARDNGAFPAALAIPGEAWWYGGRCLRSEHMHWLV